MIPSSDDEKPVINQYFTFIQTAAANPSKHSANNEANRGSDSKRCV